MSQVAAQVSKTTVPVPKVLIARIDAVASALVDTVYHDDLRLLADRIEFNRIDTTKAAHQLRVKSQALGARHPAEAKTLIQIAAELATF